MEDILREICKEYGFNSVKLMSYKGGYPIVKIEYGQNTLINKYKNKELKRLIRKAEVNAGLELGVGLNFIKTGEVEFGEGEIVVTGHIALIRKIISGLIIMKD